MLTLIFLFQKCQTSVNGIYSREMSNIYAKPVKDGKSTYVLSEEEKEAINKAIQS